MAKRLAHGCYVGYFWPGHKPNQGVVAGDGGGGGAVWGGEETRFKKREDP